MSASLPPRAPIVNIQYLRAIAALMVVWVHAREQYPITLELFPSSAGSHGVDLFFVISGFIMVYTTHGKQVQPGHFLWRRFLRIAPLYWLVTLTIVAIALLAPSLLKSTVLVATHVLASLAFIPMQSPAFEHYMWPLLVPGWTLNYEMAFYALFAACLWLPERLRTPVLCVTLLVLVSWGKANDIGGVLAFYSDAIVLSFATGAVLGELYCRGALQRLGSRIGWLALALGVLLWLMAHSFPPPHRFFAAGVPATLVVLGACVIAPIAPDRLWWLEKLGDATYSIYVGHVLLLGALRFACNKIGFAVIDEGSAVVFMVLALATSAIGGWLLYRLVELPMAQVLATGGRR